MRNSCRALTSKILNSRCSITSDGNGPRRPCDMKCAIQRSRIGSRYARCHGECFSPKVFSRDWSQTVPRPPAGSVALLVTTTVTQSSRGTDAQDRKFSILDTLDRSPPFLLPCNQSRHPWPASGGSYENEYPLLTKSPVKRYHNIRI